MVFQMNADEAFEKLAQEGLKQFLEKNPEWATFLGFHEPYDKLLSNGSIETDYENLKLMEDWLTKMKKTINFDELNDDNKMDWRIFEQAYESQKFSYYKQRTHEKNPEALGTIGMIIFIALTRDYAPFEQRIEGIVSRLEKLPVQLEQFRTSFEKCVPVKLWTEIAIEQGQQMPGYFQFLIGATKGNVSEALHQRLQKAVAALGKPIKRHLEWLNALLPKAKADWVLGKAKFERLLELRELGMSADEIYELGVEYLKELKKRKAELADKIAPGKKVETVMKEIRADAPKTFEETLDFTRKEMERAKKFVIDHNLATIDEGGKLYVRETPAFLAPLIPFAALVVPGKFEKTQEGIYIVTKPRKVEDMGKFANYASIPNTAVHEAYPGHFLATSRSNRLSSFMRDLAQGAETSEGWAHYCEEMMMQHGFQGGLKSELMQVNAMITRAVRIIVDVKLSCGEMSVDEAVDLLMKETGMAKEGAIAEARRYTQNPGYPLSYLLGKHLILKLRENVKARMGDKYSEKFFHDVITANQSVSVRKLKEIFDLKLGKS